MRLSACASSSAFSSETRGLSSFLPSDLRERVEGLLVDGTELPEHLVAREARRVREQRERRLQRVVEARGREHPVADAAEHQLVALFELRLRMSSSSSLRA